MTNVTEVQLYIIVLRESAEKVADTTIKNFLSALAYILEALERVHTKLYYEPDLVHLFSTENSERRIRLVSDQSNPMYIVNGNMVLYLCWFGYKTELFPTQVDIVQIYRQSREEKEWTTEWLDTRAIIIEFDAGLNPKDIVSFLAAFTTKTGNDEITHTQRFYPTMVAQILEGATHMLEMADIYIGQTKISKN